MPSSRALPTVDELRAAFHDAVRALRSRTSDTSDGSMYDNIAGPSAILWSQQAQRDRDLYRAIYFATADGDDLTNYVETRFDITRGVDAPGSGWAMLKRSTVGTSGTIWKGTGIQVSSATTLPQEYIVSADTFVDVTDQFVLVPIESANTGYGVSCDIGNVGASVLDPLFTTFTVDSIRCSEGTVFEKASDYRARVLSARTDNRVGYPKGIVQAARDAGAYTVALFRGDYGGDDQPISPIYVADRNFTTTTTLVQNVTVGLESWRVCGVGMSVRGMTPVQLSVNATVTLWDDPSKFNTQSILLAMRTALVSYFAASDTGYSYQRDTLAGLMAGVTSSVQSVNIVTPSVDSSVLNLGAFPLTLNRYQLTPSNVSITFVGP